MLLGLLTPVAALATIGIMIAAIVLATGRHGLFIQNDGYEYNLILIALVVS
jgi:putative oxidoreductase